MNTITRNALMNNIQQEQLKSTDPEHINNLLTMKEMVQEAYRRDGKASRISYEDLEAVN